MQWDPDLTKLKGGRLVKKGQNTKHLRDILESIDLTKILNSSLNIKLTKYKVKDFINVDDSTLKALCPVRPFRVNIWLCSALLIGKTLRIGRLDVNQLVYYVVQPMGNYDWPAKRVRTQCL